MADVLKVLVVLLLSAIGLLTLAATACGALFGGGGVLLIGLTVAGLCLWGIVALIKSMGNHKHE